MAPAVRMPDGRMSCGLGERRIPGVREMLRGMQSQASSYPAFGPNGPRHQQNRKCANQPKCEPGHGDDSTPDRGWSRILLLFYVTATQLGRDLAPRWFRTIYEEFEIFPLGKRQRNP